MVFTTMDKARKSNSLINNIKEKSGKMQDNQEYLDMVLSKLRNRIQELNIRIDEGAKDVEEMHDYYWSNYTEMDEYGYENFDNQQALLTQMNSNNQQLDLKKRFKKMLDSPYFGRIDFVYDGEDEVERYYIGIGNFAESAGGVPLVLDWRAPLAALFYDFDKGRGSFEAPGGTMEGDITGKWQYKIKGGKLIYAFESDVKIDDEILMNELGGNGDVKLKNIVSTIQKEQNQIIRNVNDKIMVVQGVAGSGKTSIALHRIAYLLYHDRKNLKASNILILSPNGVFADYISHILPELGEENIKEMSFDIFAYKELKGIVADCEERYDQIERLLMVENDEIYNGSDIGERYNYKQSIEFANEINGYVLELESELMNFKDIKYKFVNKPAKDIMELFYYKFPDIPILSRMEAVAEYVIDEAETLNGRNLDDMEIAIIMETFNQMYVTTDIYRLYSEFLEKCQMPGLPQAAMENRKLRYEDVFPMLYLKYKLLQRKNKREIKHLVIDEMQDYTYIQYLLIRQLFDCKMTIVGDKAQTMADAKSDVMVFLPKIFGKDIKLISMNKSYRQTVEIATYAANINGENDVVFLDRHGKAPVIENNICLMEALDKISEVLIKSIDKYDTFAIITMTEKETLDIYEKVKKILEQKGVDTQKRLSFIDKDTKEFKKGIVVTTFYLAKGLEFDQVYSVYDMNDIKPLHKQAKYIMATRALHELYVYEITQ